MLRSDRHPEGGLGPIFHFKYMLHTKEGKQRAMALLVRGDGSGRAETGSVWPSRDRGCFNRNLSYERI